MESSVLAGLVASLWALDPMGATYLPLFDEPPLPAPKKVAVRRPGCPSRDEIQDEILRRTHDMRAAGRKSALWWVATGVGKSRTAARYIKHLNEQGKRCLFLVHRDILVSQASGEFGDNGIKHAVEQADRRAASLASGRDGLLCVVGSKDSMQGSRLEEWPKDAFDTIIIDEGHLATSKTWSNVLEWFDYKFLLVLTATPYRMDGTQLYGPKDSLLGSGGWRKPWPLEGLRPTEKIHDVVAFKYSLATAIRNGHLADIIAVPVDLTLDIRGIRVSKGKGGDFNRGDLDDRISELADELANKTRQHLDRLGIKKAVAFCPDVGSSKTMADALNAVGVSAKAVWTGSKKHPLSAWEKKAILDQYDDGQFQVIVSCEVLTTGWDSPETQAVIMYRPTKSQSLALQMVGRGTRILPGKEKMYVIGFNWECDDGGVIGTLDMLMEPDPTPQMVQAVKEFRPKQDYSAVEVMEKLRENAERLEEEERQRKERDRIRLSVKKKDIKHHYRQFSVFNSGDVLGLAQPIAPDKKGAKHNPPTEHQVQLLKEYGLGGMGGLNRDSAQVIIDACLEREFTRKASPGAVAKLAKNGVPIEEARQMTAEQAAARLARNPVRERMRRWLKHALGKSDSQIDRMTHREACIEYGRWKAGQTANRGY